MPVIRARRRVVKAGTVLSSRLRQHARAAFPSALRGTRGLCRITARPLLIEDEVDLVEAVGARMHADALVDALGGLVLLLHVESQAATLPRSRASSSHADRRGGERGRGRALRHWCTRSGSTRTSRCALAPLGREHHASERGRAPRSATRYRPRTGSPGTAAEARPQARFRRVPVSVSLAIACWNATSVSRILEAGQDERRSPPLETPTSPWRTPDGSGVAAVVVGRRLPARRQREQALLVEEAGR